MLMVNLCHDIELDFEEGRNQLLHAVPCSVRQPGVVAVVVPIGSCTGGGAPSEGSCSTGRHAWRPGIFFERLKKTELEKN